MSFAKKVRRYRAWIAVALLVIVGGIAYSIWSSPKETELTTSYETEVAAISTISSTISGTGNMAVFDSTDVYPTVNGTVLTLSVAEGDLVKAGTVLYTLDASDAEANSAKTWSSVEQSKQGVKQADQSVVQAQSQLLKAENALAALEERSEAPSSTVTTGEIDHAEKDVEAAEAQLVTAYAQQDAADASLYSANVAHDNAKAAESDFIVTSPVDGVVWSVGIEEGDAVSLSTAGGTTAAGGTSSEEPPIVVAPSDPLAVQLAINEVDVPPLELNQRTELEFDALADLTITGKVTEIADEGTVEQGVVTYNVWIALDVTDDRLKSGMSAAATIITEVAKNELIVANAAVQTDSDDQAYVLVLDDPEGEPRTVYVTLGVTSSTHTVITEGLAEGDLVVTRTVTEDGDEEDAGGGAIMMPGMGGGRP